MPSTTSDRVYNRLNSWLNIQTPWLPTSIAQGGTFRAWATGVAAPPPGFPGVTASCFEIVLAAAALSNVRNQGWYSGMYNYADGAIGVTNWMRRWTANLVGLTGHNGPLANVINRLEPYNAANNVPVRGDIVFFNMSGTAGLFHHVAVATGLTYNGHSGILSFFGAGPNQNTPVIRTSIERMVALGGQCHQWGAATNVFFARPPW